MSKRIIISVDPGKFATKAVTGDLGSGKRVEFRTKTLKLSEDVDLDIQGKSYKVEYENSTYVIGDQGEEVNYSVDKATMNHKIATYTAIAQLLGDAEIVDLVLGCPTSVYKNKKLREEYKNYILSEKPIQIRINGKLYVFHIANIIVMPEGSGIAFVQPELFKGKRVAVVDIGGLNMNFATYNNLIPEITSMFTTNHGNNELETILINDLSTKYGSTFSSFDVQQAIKQGGVKVRGEIDPSSTKTINAALEVYMIKLIQETKKNNFNLELMDVVFVGGTSLFMKDKILEHLPHAVIPNNPQWANVIGFNNLGVMKYARL